MFHLCFYFLATVFCSCLSFSSLRKGPAFTEPVLAPDRVLYDSVPVSTKWSSLHAFLDKLLLVTEKLRWIILLGIILGFITSWAHIVSFTLTPASICLLGCLTFFLPTFISLLLLGDIQLCSGLTLALCSGLISGLACETTCSARGRAGRWCGRQAPWTLSISWSHGFSLNLLNPKQVSYSLCISFAVRG